MSKEDMTDNNATVKSKVSSVQEEMTPEIIDKSETPDREEFSDREELTPEL
jgi:hypothetical protein